MTAEAIEKTFREIGPREGQARECLADHGRSAQYPFIDKEKEPERKRSTIFETQACNLIPDLMALPVVAPNQKISWEPLSIEVSEVKGLPVYSLDVERHHTYVADGIVTHNSIYQWSGASANLFLDRAKLARYHIQLRQTHRYGQEIVDFSGRIISRVARRHPKEIIGVQGQGGRVIHSGEFKPVTGDVLIMNRHVHGCQAIADAYIAAGLPFINERGKDPLNAFARVSAWETLNTLAKGESVGMSHASSMIEELMKSVVDGDHGKKVRLVVHGAKAKFENFANERVGLYDLVKANVLTQEGMNVISEREYWTLKHPLDLEYYDRVVKNGYSLEANPEHIPKITTIHGSKGREAKQAIVFSEMSNRCWDDPDSEHRLAYVAATRTQSDLTVCAENTVDWAKSQYHYPFQDEEK
jgi:superfamily I DNA/RNA helicase